MSVILITAFLIIEVGCKKETVFTCPELITPQKYTSFHAGDTITILVYLPSPIQKDTGRAFVHVWSYITMNTLPKLDTAIYPTFGNNHYSSTYIVLSTTGNQIDTLYIGTGIGSLAAGLECQGITVYVNP